VLTVLCIATYRKGDEFLRECRRQGCRVLLLTEEKLADADWPREAIDEFYYLRRDMPEADIRKGAAFVARTERIDRIVALDDFDVELAAMLREYLSVPGMGQTTARAFRDKLAMRRRARAAGIPCPDFVPAINLDGIRDWAARVPAPWILKPRGQAAAIGLRKLTSTEDLWSAIGALGDAHADYLLEAFVPGDVYHVDSIVVDRQVVFSVASAYTTPPMAVAHEGGIFITRTLDDTDPAAVALTELNRRVLDAFGLVRGVSHTEFICGTQQGSPRVERAGGPGEARSTPLSSESAIFPRIEKQEGWFFLETSARVGGAFIVDVIEAARGINLWREWSRVEIAGEDGGYELPPRRNGYAGIVLSLARQEEPDTSAYADPEIVQRIRKRHHAGLIVASPDPDRVQRLLADYAVRFKGDFHASAPPPTRALD
jgi:biotin carboxylase